MDAIVDLSSVGIVIANVLPADDSSSSDGDSDGDSDDDQLDMMHATAHHDDEPVDDANLDVLSGLSDDENTDDDTSDISVPSAAANAPPSTPPAVHAGRPDQPVKATTSKTLTDRSGHPQHKQRACAYVSKHAKQSNDRALRYKRPQHASRDCP